MGFGTNERAFDLDYSKYYGRWYEIGKYYDPSEASCNGVVQDVFPAPNKPEGSYVIHRYCICGPQLNVCGKANQYVMTRIKGNEYHNDAGQKLWILWTDYTNWSIVGNDRHVWIYKRNANVTPSDLNTLFYHLTKLGYEPSRIQLTGAAVSSLAKQGYATGTIVEPFCSSKSASAFGRDVACNKITGTTVTK